MSKSKNTTTTQSAKLSKQETVDDAPVKKVPKKKVSVAEESNDDAPPVKKAPKKKADAEEDAAPAKKAPKKKAAAEEDGAPAKKVPKKKAAAEEDGAPAKKAPKKKAAAAEEDGSEEEDVEPDAAITFPAIELLAKVAGNQSVTFFNTQALENAAINISSYLVEAAKALKENMTPANKAKTKNIIAKLGYSKKCVGAFKASALRVNTVVTNRVIVPLKEKEEKKKAILADPDYVPRVSEFTKRRNFTAPFAAWAKRAYSTIKNAAEDAESLFVITDDEGNSVVDKKTVENFRKRFELIREKSDDWSDPNRAYAAPTVASLINLWAEATEHKNRSKITYDETLFELLGISDLEDTPCNTLTKYIRSHAQTNDVVKSPKRRSPMAARGVRV